VVVVGRKEVGRREELQVRVRAGVAVERGVGQDLVHQDQAVGSPAQDQGLVQDQALGLDPGQDQNLAQDRSLAQDQKVDQDQDPGLGLQNLALGQDQVQLDQNLDLLLVQDLDLLNRDLGQDQDQLSLAQDQVQGLQLDQDPGLLNPDQPPLLDQNNGRWLEPGQCNLSKVCQHRLTCIICQVYTHNNAETQQVKYNVIKETGFIVYRIACHPT